MEELARMLLLYYPDPAVDERRRPGPGLEDDGVTATGATAEDQENRRRRAPRRARGRRIHEKG